MTFQTGRNVIAYNVGSSTRAPWEQPWCRLNPLEDQEDALETVEAA